MIHSSTRAKITAVVLLAGVLPVLASMAGRSLFGDTPYIQEPLHEAVELTGSCIALGVAMLLLLRLQHENTSPHLLWVVAALVAMGLVDAVHSLLPFGAAFSWTRHGGTLVGGLIFGLIWLPVPAIMLRRKQQSILLLAALAMVGALAICLWPERLPAPWVAGKYSRLVIAANALGGLGFLSASLFFFLRYFRQPQNEDLVFASHTLLFGMASLFFGFSHVWAADWWVWHGARLLAYSVVLASAYEVVVTAYQHIARYAQELEGRVLERTADLATKNTMLQIEIAERNRAEEALLESKEELQRFLKSMINAFALFEAVFDDDGHFVSYRFVYINQAYERITGVTNDVVRGKTIHEVWPETEPEWIRRYGEVAVTGVSQTFDMYHQPTGKHYHCNVYRPTDRQDRFCVVFEDITERKRMEKELVTQSRIADVFLTVPDEDMYNEVLKVVLEIMQSPFGVFGYIDEEDALVVPSMTRQIWGKCQVPDKTFVFPRATWGCASWPRAIREKSPNYTNEPSANVPEGHIDIRRHISFPIMLQGEAIGLLQVANSDTDYTEADIRSLEAIAGYVAPVLDARLKRERQEAARLRALVDLERSNKELEQFAYVASHDLQEPLRMISSYTQLLGERYAGQLDEKAKKYMGYAVDGAVRMQRLINDLLAYSRVGTRGNPIESTDAHSVLGEAIRNLAAMIEENKAIITNEDLPVVRADAAQLVQVFQNLLANAIKFRGEVLPRVHVSVREEGHEWVFSVKDNGIGIDPQYADRVFVIFQRLHTRQEYPGTGIGLAICKRIVERHGGKIWYESEPGKGTTFFFTIQKGAS